MFKTRKILSLALTLAMLLSAVFCTGAVANAEDATATLPTTCKMSRLTLSSTEEDMDWSLLGQNLIPDSTVAEFDSEGNYDTYYADETNGTGLNNPNAHWGKATLKHNAYSKGEEEYKGPARRGQIDKNVSHTADGSGSLCITPKSEDDYEGKRLNMPIGSGMRADSWYLITFWIKASSAGNVKLHTKNDWSGTYNVFEVNATTDWQRITALAYCYDPVNHKDRYGAYVCVEEVGTKTVYVDEIEQYKVDLDYAQKCIDAGNILLNGKEEYITSDTVGLTNLTSSGQYETFDFDYLGENLAYDPTVSKFVDDGTGTMVYDDTNGMRAGEDGYTTDEFGSPKNQNSAKTDVSHTNDGSGAIVYSTTKNWTLKIAPKLQKKSYYLITYYFKTASSTGCNIRHVCAQNWASGNWKELGGNYSTSWKRFTYIVYTGNQTHSGAIGTYNICEIAFDDFGVYRLDPEYASKCVTAGKLLTETDLRADEDFASFTATAMTGTAVEDFDFETLTENLIPDPTVKEFNEDGTYKTYYASMGSTHATSTVANPNAWWAVPASFSHVQGQWGGWSNWIGPGLQTGKITNDNQYSHTIGDGSGALKTTTSTNLYLPLPTLKAKTYYVLTLWIKNGKNNAMLTLFKNGGAAIKAQERVYNTGTGWNRYTYLIRTGTSDLAATNAINIYAESETYVDDIGLYEIDAYYGAECMTAGKLLGNAGNTASVEATANTAYTITPDEGYFIPYGAMATTGGTMAEKLGNGQFFAKTADTYSYKQFKYPSGIVGTFGASVKITGDKGIQFGSLVTDNLSTKSHGTLVIRGDFDAFRATLPSYTREQIFNILYNNLKTNNIASGEAVNVGNAGEVIAVMYVDRTKYMWKNSENTELQYAVRLYNVEQNFADVEYTAVGYVTTADDELVFSNTIKSDKYSNHVSN